jgi:hypothetical protein
MVLFSLARHGPPLAGNEPADVEKPLFMLLFELLASNAPAQLRGVFSMRAKPFRPARNQQISRSFDTAKVAFDFWDQLHRTNCDRTLRNGPNTSICLAADDRQVACARRQ